MAALAFLTVTEILFRCGVISFGIGSLGKGGWKLGVAAIIYIFLLYVALIPLKYGTAWFYFQEAHSTSIPGSGFFSCYMHRKHIKGTLKLEFMVTARRMGVAGLSDSVYCAYDVAFQVAARPRSDCGGG